ARPPAAWSPIPTADRKYTSLHYTDRLDEHGIAPSVGSRGDAYDNDGRSLRRHLQVRTRRRPAAELRKARARDAHVDQLLPPRPPPRRTRRPATRRIRAAQETITPAALRAARGQPASAHEGAPADLGHYEKPPNRASTKPGALLFSLWLCCGFGWSGEESAAVDDGVCDVGELAVAVAGVCAEEVEGCAFVEVVAFHEDAFGALDQCAACECAFEVLELCEAAQDDVEGALQLLGFAVGDVGEDAAFGGLVDEVAVVGLEDRDHGAGCLADDLVDQVERVLAALAQADQRNVGPLTGGERGHVCDVDRAGDHLVAEAGDDHGDVVEPLRALICDQDSQMIGCRKAAHARTQSLGSRIYHRTRPSCGERSRSRPTHSVGFAGTVGHSCGSARAADRRSDTLAGVGSSPGLTGGADSNALVSGMNAGPVVRRAECLEGRG